MEESYGEDLASHTGLQPYADHGNVVGVASVRGSMRTSITKMAVPVFPPVFPPTRLHVPNREAVLASALRPRVPYRPCRAPCRAGPHAAPYGAVLLAAISSGRFADLNEAGQLIRLESMSKQPPGAETRRAAGD